MVAMVRGTVGAGMLLRSLPRIANVAVCAECKPVWVRGCASVAVGAFRIEMCGCYNIVADVYACGDTCNCCWMTRAS